EVGKWDTSSSQLSNQGADLGRWETGSYLVQLSSVCNAQVFGFSNSCFASFKVVPPGQNSDGVIENGSGNVIAQLPPPCGKTDRNEYVCDTALGKITTVPQKLLGQILGILLSLAGGFALLLIIFSGYQFMTSQGNQEAAQGARETLTSAIVGLLF